MFSDRTQWLREPNKLSSRLNERLASGKPVYDLTISNPIAAGIEYPRQEILRALSHRSAFEYSPDPRGLLSAREAIAQYYASRGEKVNPADIILTASTSEAYSFLFTLLCEAGDNVLVPTPSYPLFEFLTRIHHVHIQPYHLRYDGEWHIDVGSVRETITGTTKAIILIDPHNPTGMFLKKDEIQNLSEIAREKNLPLIIDEVFSEYDLTGKHSRPHGNFSDLTFTLNGISKLCGLPQLKLGWIVVGGNESAKQEALHRLEIIADTFLSINTPVQVALPELLRLGVDIRKKIRRRVEHNLFFLKNAIRPGSPLSLLHVEGGWSALLKIPATHSEEEWALKLLDGAGVYVFPGYFFDFQESGILVVSLLATADKFQKGIEELQRLISY